MIFNDNYKEIKLYRDDSFALFFLLDKISKKEIHKIEQSCILPKTYIMRNNYNGYHKIGKSVDPKVRERTLQAEEPDIELLAICDADIEKQLHDKYDAHRLRGEWFDLGEKNVSDIMDVFKGHLVDDEQLDMFKGGE